MKKRDIKNLFHLPFTPKKRQFIDTQCCGHGSGMWDPGSVLFRPLDPLSRMAKKIRINIPDHNSESLETIFWVKNT
jgi:hypothetical protein